MTRTFKTKTAAPLLAAALLALTACSGAGSTAAQSTADTAASTAQATAAPAATATPTPQPTAAPAASWLKEPYLEVDYLEAIPYSRTLSGEWGNENTDFNSTRNMVTLDGYTAYSNQPANEYGDRDTGIIDSDGNILAEDQYFVCCGFGGKYALELRGDSTEYEAFTLDEAGALQPLTNEETLRITGTSTNPSLCWVEADQALYVYGYGDATIYPDVISVKDPVAALWLDAMPADGMVPYSPDVPDAYVLTDGTKPINEDTYEAVGAYSSGVFAVKKDGKWGYVDATGTLVIPCEYDASWAVPSASFAERCYSATENTVVLCQNGQYALYGTDNTEIIPFGEYEALRPVYDGKLWAKQDGKWGILKLNETT